MAVSTKAVASGVAGVGGTAAAGYGISTAIEQQNSESKQQNSQLREEAEKLTIDQKLRREKYEVLNPNVDDQKWEFLSSAAAMKEGKSSNVDFLKKQKELQTRCREILDVIYSDDKKEMYNEAIQKCTKLLNLKEISEKSGLVPLTTEHKEIIKTKWTETSNKSVLRAIQAYELEFSSGDKDYETAVERCTDHSARFNRFTDKLQEALNNYKRLCTATSEEISNQRTS